MSNKEKKLFLNKIHNKKYNTIHNIYIMVNTIKHEFRFIECYYVDTL